MGEDWAFHQICTHELGGLETFLDELALIAELRAIDAAIRAHLCVRLTVVTDSKAAIGLAREWMTGGSHLPNGYTTFRNGGKTTGLQTMRRLLHRETHRFEFAWFRGHDGEPLNEGADGLAPCPAIASGRSGPSKAEYHERAKGLAQAFAETASGDHAC